MLQEPNSFSTAVHGLLSCQRQALAIRSNAGGEHLCFLGCGELENDQYTHMVVASFLQKHIHFVSIVEGGYKCKFSINFISYFSLLCGKFRKYSNFRNLFWVYI